jgi:hypothetical protein
MEVLREKHPLNVCSQCTCKHLSFATIPTTIKGRVPPAFWRSTGLIIFYFSTTQPSFGQLVLETPQTQPSHTSRCQRHHQHAVPLRSKEIHSGEIQLAAVTVSLPLILPYWPVYCFLTLLLTIQHGTRADPSTGGSESGAESDDSDSSVTGTYF